MDGFIDTSNQANPRNPTSYGNQSYENSRRLVQDLSSSIEIDECEYPVEYCREQYDATLVYAEEDVDEAVAAKEFIEKHVLLDNGQPPLIALLDRTGDLNHINYKLKHLEVACRHSTYMIMLLTKNFCKSKWAAIQKEELIMESIDDPDKQWCIIVIQSQRRDADQNVSYSTPFGLKAIKPMDFFRLTGGNKFAEVLPTLEKDEIMKKDRYILKNITSLFNKRHYLKEKRAKQNEEDREQWLKEEQQRRYEKKQKKIKNEGISYQTESARRNEVHNHYYQVVNIEKASAVVVGNENKTFIEQEDVEPDSPEDEPNGITRNIMTDTDAPQEPSNGEHSSYGVDLGNAAKNSEGKTPKPLVGPGDKQWERNTNLAQRQDISLPAFDGVSSANTSIDESIPSISQRHLTGEDITDLPQARTTKHPEYNFNDKESSSAVTSGHLRELHVCQNANFESDSYGIMLRPVQSDQNDNEPDTQVKDRY